MKTTNEIEGFILAGGASSRMGRDKSRLILGKTTFIERAARSLAAVSGESVSIVGNDFNEQPEVRLTDEGTFLKLRVLPDLYRTGEKDFRASIIGLHSALAHARSDWIAVLACDLPFASGELLKRLAGFRAGQSKRVEAVVPRQPDGRLQPLCALYYRQTCLTAVEEMLGEKSWSLKEVLRRVETREVEFSEIANLPGSDRFFLNINTPADYQNALKLILP